jgi:hypothetical protein
VLESWQAQRDSPLEVMMSFVWERPPVLRGPQVDGLAHAMTRGGGEERYPVHREAFPPKAPIRDVSTKKTRLHDTTRVWCARVAPPRGMPPAMSQGVPPNTPGCPADEST